MRTLVPLAVVVVALGACSPTFAPPVRTGVGSTPRAMNAPLTETLVVALGGDEKGYVRAVHELTPNVALESSLVANVDRDHPEQRFLLGGPGVILSTDPLWSWLRVDLSAGLGLGCGGVVEGEGGCNRAAAGAHTGIDLGAELFWDLHLYVANRLQVSVAQEVPTTVWGLHMAGLQWDASPRWFFSIELGPWWYENRVEKESAMTGNLAVGLRWDERR